MIQNSQRLSARNAKKPVQQQSELAKRRAAEKKRAKPSPTLAPEVSVTASMLAGAKRFIAEELKLDEFVDADDLIAAVEASKTKFKRQSNRSKVQAVQHAYAHYVMLSDPANAKQNDARLRDWAKESGQRITKATKPVHIVLRYLIDYEGNPKTQGSLLRRDTSAIRYLMSASCPPADVMKLSEKKGEGLNEWSKKAPPAASAAETVIPAPQRVTEKDVGTHPVDAVAARYADYLARIARYSTMPKGSLLDALKLNEAAITFFFVDPAHGGTMQKIEVPLAVAGELREFWVELKSIVESSQGKIFPPVPLPKGEQSESSIMAVGPQILQDEIDEEDLKEEMMDEINQHIPPIHRYGD